VIDLKSIKGIKYIKNLLGVT